MRVGNKDDNIRNMGEEQRTGLSIGPALRSAREKRGLSLEEVERATKIRIRYLEGLEREEYDMLPARIYARGFLKTYANFLGFDGETLSRELEDGPTGGEEAGKSDARESPESLSGSMEPRPSGPLPVARALSGPDGRTSAMSLPLYAIAGVALVAFVGVVYLLVSGLHVFDGSGRQQNHDNAGFVSNNKASNKGGTPVSKTVKKKKKSANGSRGGTKKSAVPGTIGGGKSSPPPARTDQGPLEAGVRVVDADSWIEVRTDGIISYSHLTQPGFSQTFEAKRRVVILTGNAGAVRVSLNGQNLGALGQDGQVLTKVYTVKNASPDG